MAVSQKCFAYKILKKQIGQQCKIYQSLHKKGKLGKLPGMYVPNEEGRDIPSESTSAFLRGGIINTIACFEAYLHDLLNEATDTILYKRKECHGTCKDCIQLKYEHVVARDDANDPMLRHHNIRNPEQLVKLKERNSKLVDGDSLTWHNIVKEFSYKFGRAKDSFTQELLGVGGLGDFTLQDQQRLEHQQQKQRHDEEKKDLQPEKLLNQLKEYHREIRLMDALDLMPELEELKYKYKRLEEKFEKIKARESEAWLLNLHAGDENREKVARHAYQALDLFLPELLRSKHYKLKKKIEKYQAQHEYDDQLHRLTDVLNLSLPEPLRFKHSVIKRNLKVAQKQQHKQQQQKQFKSLKYYYLVDLHISEVNIVDEDLLDRMLKLCYGIRNIMAHGNASEALQNGVLKNFPVPVKPNHDCLGNDCQHKSCNVTIRKLRKIVKLNQYFETCIEEQGKKRVLKKSRHYPRPEPLRKLRNEADKAIELLEDLFPAISDDDFLQVEILDENYALFHMCRIHSYLKENKRMMYITYRLLVRINQFILVLAHRMRIAVGRILIYKYSLPDGTWGVPSSTQGQICKINKFEKGHKDLMLSILQKCCDK